MANTVLVQSQVAALNVDSLNRDAIYTAGNLSNGSVFQLTTLSVVAGQGELFTVVAPAAQKLSNLWMAASPEVVDFIAPDGTVYRGLSIDPRNFTNIAGKPLAAYKPAVEDEILITADGITGASLAGLTVGQYAVAAAGVFTLSPSAAVIAGLTYFVDSIGTMTIANGSSLSQQVPAAKLKCVAIA